MKQLINIAAFALIAATTFTSCTKVIDANLGQSPDLYVIEGTLADSSYPIVKISRLIDVDKNNDFPPVLNAVVSITDNHGNSYALVGNSEGIYKTTDTMGTPGDTYNLKVEIDGKIFTASSTMPKKIYIDSLGTREFRFGPEPSLFPTIHYTDPVGQGNNYRAILWHNDTLRTDIYIEDDKFSDGNSRQATLFSQNFSLKPGDSFTVEMQCIDRNVYDYYYILMEVDGSSGLASPGNPQSNISGGALGFFSAHTSVTMRQRVD